MSDVIFTSRATAKNGREGFVKFSSQLIHLNLVHPPDAKGEKGTNPEELFAAAYAACFDGALNLAANNLGKKLDSTTTANVSFLKDREHGGFKIAVVIEVKIDGVNPETAEELVEAAHQICPYSKATRGNIDVKLIPQAVE